MKQLSQYQNNPINPRSITREAMDRLKASIELDPEFMQLRPIIVDAENIILCGNQRFTACQELGLEEVQDSWVVEAGELSDEKRRRLVLIDNTPDGLGGDWDIDELLKSFTDLDLGALGFDLEAMGQFAVEESEAPELKDGDREPFQQMTFTLHDDQAAIINKAMDKAKANGPFDGLNENSNGNALARIAEVYCG